MDYDDKDISRHNLQLAGEGRSKSPSKLRPYDFPKFDFDDNLQAHLRFDSLAETEVFLGIQSQEHNHWIEDFSRGSNGMEFNSTPTDSCSIARQNNVWSEATSSESVEMLLNSVGQEEIRPGESFIPVSSASHDQGTLVKHVEPASGLDTAAYPANSEPALPQDELLKDYPASQGHVQGQLPDAEEPFQVAQANVESVFGKDGASIDKRKHSYHDEYFNEPKTTAEKTMNCETGEDSAHFTDSDINVNVSSNLGMLEQVNVDVVHESCSGHGQGKHVCSGSGVKGSKILEGITGDASIPIYTNDSSADLVAKSGVLDSQDAVKGSHVCVNEDADIATDTGSELKPSEGGEMNVALTPPSQIREQGVKVSCINNEMAGPVEDHQKGSAGGGIDQHSAELGSLTAVHCASPEQKMDSSVLLTCRQDDDKAEEVQISAAKKESSCELPLLSIDDKKAPIESSVCIDKTKTSVSSDMVLSCSDTENKETGNVGGCRNDSIVAVAEPCAHTPTAVMDDSKQGIEDSLAHRQADFTEAEQDICRNKEENKSLPTVAENAENDQRSQFDVRVGVKVNDVAGHTKSRGSAERDENAENGRQEPAVIGLPCSDTDCEETSSMIVSDTNVGTQVASIAKAEVNVPDDASGTALSKMPVKSLQNAGRSIDVTSCESPSAETIKSSYINHSPVHFGGGKSSLKENVDADVVCSENQQVPMMKVEGEKESEQAAEVDKASCGSPTIISSNEPSQIEKGNQDEAWGSEVRDVQLTSEDPNRIDAIVDDTTFSFKVHALPDTTEKTPGSSWSPFSSAEKCNSPRVLKDTKSSGEKTTRTPKQKSLPQSALVSDTEPMHGTSKGTSERKGRRGSAKGTAKESTKKKGNQVKGTNQDSAKRDKGSDSLVRTSIGGPNVHLGKVQPHGHLEQSNTKLSGAAAVPDLNTSALNTSNSASASFQQPFTDLQQVQLRAQIFVYGSLIQGTAPDEACMVSAFGSSDGRTIWEPVWQAAVERFRNQKSNSGAAETPLRSDSAARTSDAAVKQGSHSSKVLSSPTARASSKGSPTAIVNQIIPSSSPFWSISTPLRDSLPASGPLKGPTVDYQHAVAPLHTYQTPPVRNIAGHMSWPSQSIFPGPWLGSPQSSTLNAGVCFQPVTMTETVKLTPIKDTSRPLTSGMKQPTSSPVQTVVPSPTYVGVSLFPDTKASAERHSLDSKPRKRKKVQASDLGQVSLLPVAQTQPVINSKVGTSPAVSTSAFPALASSAPSTSVPATFDPAFPASDGILKKVIPDAIAVGSIDHVKKGELDAGKAVKFSEETLSKVAEAKSQAEDAAALAATAVSHCEDLWRQLAKQKECGLNSEVEINLASAAVAIAAATSVAKAAAAAANVACNAALQAKLMADEGFLSEKTSGMVPSSGKYSTDVHDIGNAMPTSILKGDGVTNQSGSILIAAKEAAKRQVEAASAASKQAENLDAIVKAAELAATAVSQAGKIVAMREPLPLSDLIESGPEGFWKLTQSTSVLAEKLMDSNKGATDLEADADFPAKSSKEDSVLKGGVKSVGHGKVHLRERSNDSLEDDIIHSRHSSETDLRSGAQNDQHELVGTPSEDSIKEGFSVEVFKHGDGLKSAWYSANVLNLDDGKAYVCYSDRLSEEGSGNLREWVPLECEGDKAPMVRAALPSTALQSEGTRKRRRAALGDYAWCVGDRVDVWVDDCWWEGVVTEKNEKDETTLKVHFPAQGETSTVRAWNLRTSRSWNNGKWVECCSSKGHNGAEQSDMPKEKRQKLGSPAVPSKGNNELPNNVDSASGKPESKFLHLSTSDRIFNVGKTTIDDKYAARRPLRTGQQKEGSRVILGVPKPTGKKRKFMEVSKHFPANKSDKSNGPNDSVKFVKYLMPQAPQARGWKVPSRSDSKEKRTAEARSRVHSSRKSNRTLPQRNNLNSTLTQDFNLRNRGKDIEDSVGHDEDTSEKVEHDSSATEEVAEAPLSSLIAQPPSTSSRKISSSNAKSERLIRGKPIPTGGKLSKIEENKVYAGNSGQSLPEVAEPRRSNRRIQPTHRLLEGLQSSMIIPKMPSVSHDKVQRNPSRNVFSRGK